MIELTDRDKKMLELWDQGYSASQVGKEINMTRNAVMGRIGRLRKAGFLGYKTKSPPIHRVSKLSKQVDLMRAEVRDLIDKKKQAFKEKNGITLLELTSQTCKYSISGDDASSYRFCGKEPWKNSYCKDHYSLCYIPSEVRKKKNKVEFKLKGI